MKNSDAASSQIQGRDRVSRRDFIVKTALVGTGLALGTSLAVSQGRPQSEATSLDQPGATKAIQSGRRRLGALEVSSVGLGCQDITGTFYATAPRRPDMIVLVRTAHDLGVT